MWEIKRLFNQIHRQLAIFMLAGLIWLIGLPMLSAQAAGYYSLKNQKPEITRRYYSNQKC